MEWDQMTNAMQAEKFWFKENRAVEWESKFGKDGEKL